ncbi:hypothetical protein [uncultured Aliivibrio sp.]|uniref:hypothetical protein n=1 Tax=uncultured Aliivibrio sp. TaxID=873085 RepID=UPI0026314E6B|nr:hypothetical protein [uncultured Aliivibrio sp.]
METKKKIALGIGGLLIVGMASSIVMDMIDNPTSRTVAATSTHLVTTAPVITEKATPTTLQPIVLELSDNAIDVISALDTSYLSTIKTYAISAEILEIEGQQKLDELKEHALYGKATIEPVVVVQQKQVTPSVVDRLQIKSIISNPNNMIAFIGISGQLIPVKKGESVEGAKVHDITRNAVVFKLGNKLITKYIKAAPIKVVIEKESGNARQQ